MIEIDHTYTKVLMIGVSEFPEDQTINPVPNVLANIKLLKSSFIDSDLVGIPESNISVSVNEDKSKIERKLKQICEETRDKRYTLLIYYSGHGILSSTDFKLYLTTYHTIRSDLEIDGIHFDTFKRYVQRSRAARKIVILDCDHSGAFNETMGDVSSILQASINDFEGSYVMTSGAADEPSLYPVNSPGEPTYFTGKFIKILNEGLDNDKEFCSLGDIYDKIEYDFETEGLPHPQQSGTGTAGQFPFSKNKKYQYKKPTPELPHQELPESNSTHTKFNVSPDSKNSQQYLELKSRLHSDEFSVEDDDILGYDLHAHNLFNIMTDKQTNPPLNIGILAPWGRGKTSLMRKVEAMFIKERKTKISAEKTVTSSRSTLNSLRKWLNGKDLFPIFKIPYATVWFNPWNYQSSDMIWAGMANAVVEQVVNQLPNETDKEAFWFQLRLSRIDKDELRKELQIRAALFVLQFVVWGIALVLSTAMFFINTSAALGILGAGTLLGVFTSVASYLKPNNKDISEVFDKYIKAPQYLNKLGTFHDVQEDLKKVFNLLISEKEPLVIFIDDLDRCSPSRVVEVVEAINVFISGEHRKKCYFVLGMDAEIVAASLDVAYEKMKGKIINRETEQGSLGWYFLDKFIQLPFFIPVISQSKKLEYLDSLLKQTESEGHYEGQDTVTGTLNEEQTKEIAKKIIASKTIDQSKTLFKGLNKAEQKEVDNEILKQQVENNHDSEEISNQVAKYSAYLNSDPRSLKRFANLLRFYNSYQILRMKKGQEYVPINYLGKYLALMTKFPQLIRWIQWDTESKNGLSTSPDLKAQLIDEAISELLTHSLQEERFQYWHDEKFKLDGENNKKVKIKIIIEMQKDMPWLKSQSLVNILLSENSLDASLNNALKCNVW